MNDFNPWYIEVVVLEFGLILRTMTWGQILENNLATAFEKFPPEQSKKILYQQDNARPHTSAKTSKYLKK
ncbi:unnamed protein product, partial [Rotaria sp. Silwood2]